MIFGSLRSFWNLSPAVDFLCSAHAPEIKNTVIDLLLMTRGPRAILNYVRLLVSVFLKKPANIILRSSHIV